MTVYIAMAKKHAPMEVALRGVHHVAILLHRHATKSKRSVHRAQSTKTALIKTIAMAKRHV
tara:strand:- start:352 stop:534 length:183 start_codon:yes stop_codon:yes gene_type:complete